MENDNNNNVSSQEEYWNSVHAKADELHAIALRLSVEYLNMIVQANNLMMEYAELYAVMSLPNHNGAEKEILAETETKSVQGEEPEKKAVEKK